LKYANGVNIAEDWASQLPEMLGWLITCYQLVARGNCRAKEGATLLVAAGWFAETPSEVQ
jgi:hypothetical protein